MKSCSVFAVAVLAGGAAFGQSSKATVRLRDYAVTNEFGAIDVLSDNTPYSSAYLPYMSFDGNDTTFYSSRVSSGAWAGFGLTTPMCVTRIVYIGRSGYTSRVTGTLIQGANLPDFSDAVTLDVVRVPAGWNGRTWVTQTLQSTNVLQTFSYVRFYCPSTGSNGGDFSEMEFYGAFPDEEVPAPPQFAFAECINWHMNITCRATNDAVFAWEVQRQFAGEDAFSVIDFIYCPALEFNWVDGQNLYRNADYRVRAHNNIGVSDWAQVTAVPRNAATGTWIGTPTGWDNSPAMFGDKAFDGDITTFFNPSSATGANGAWTGLDFGSPKTITGIRFVPRTAFPDRMINGWFEVADNPAFSPAQTIHQVQSRPPILQVTEIVFQTPVTARYARYCSANGNWGNVAEVEFVCMPEAPRAPIDVAATFTSTMDDYPVLTWSLNIGSLISSSMVYRAVSPGGPYTAITPDGLLGQTWTDLTAVPGTLYYYAVSALLNTGYGPLEGPRSPWVSRRRVLRLERDWSDLTQVKPGMTVLGAHYRPYANDQRYAVTNMFDGNSTTFPDTPDARNPAVGVDLGKPLCIQYMRFVSRTDSGGMNRLNGAELRGSNNPDYTNNFTRLATFQGSLNNWQYVTQEVENHGAFRYIFVQRPDAIEWYGNIAELELYGWDPDDCEDVLSAPTAVTIQLLPLGVVRLTWSGAIGQESYRIERKPRDADDSAWAPVGTTTANTLDDSAPILDAPSVYRIIAVRAADGGGDEEAYSDLHPVIAYVQGQGTGLTATYYADYAKDNSLGERILTSLVEPAPDWNLTQVALVNGIPGAAENIRIAWYGELLVPFAGTYTIYATSDDGVAVSIDGTPIINTWDGRAATTDQATLPLSAGPHLIRVDYFQGNGPKVMKLEWGGAVKREVIPTTQLNPLPLPEGTDINVKIGDWEGRTLNATRLGFHRMDPVTGAITIGSCGSDLGTQTDSGHYVWQRVSGDFLLEADVTLNVDALRSSGKALLGARSSMQSNAALMFTASRIAQYVGDFNVKGRNVLGANIWDAGPWTGRASNPCRMRVKRLRGIFTAQYRDNVSMVWETISTWDDSEAQVFPRALYVCLGVCSPIQTSPQMFQTATFSDITLKRLNGTVILLR